MRISGLLELDLSRNKIDEKASEALAEYLSSPTCPLYKLVLISADVDDGECAAMVECLESNRNLRELDLSNNLLGSAETIPGAATGGGWRHAGSGRVVGTEISPVPTAQHCHPGLRAAAAHPPSDARGSP